MKPFDLYQHFHKFCEMLDNDALTLKMRIDMGKDWVKSLPAPMLCVPYELSRSLIQEAMEGRLQEKCKEYGRQDRETEEETKLQREIPAQQQAQPRAEPVRETPRNGGGKAVMEAVDRPKTPKAKRQGPRKT